MDNFTSRLAFIENRCQIFLYEKYKTLQKMQDFSWLHISKLVYFTNESEICSICFDKIILPRMDKCGHLFCLSCILNSLEISKEVKVLCPMCKDVEINVNSIKRVQLCKYDVPKVGETVTFKLLVKGKENVCPRFADDLSDYKDYILPRKSNSISEFLGVVVERDYNVIRNINSELLVLKKRRSKFRDGVKKSYERTICHLTREKKNFENEIKIIDREEVDKSKGNHSSCDWKFNLLAYEKMKDRFELFYQCGKYRFAYLDEELQKEIFEIARDTKQVIPIYVRGEIRGIRGEVVDNELLLSLVRRGMNHLFVGAKLSYLSIDLEECIVGTIDGGGNLKRLLIHQEQLMRAEQEEEELRRNVARRAAERKHLQAPSRILRSNTRLNEEEEEEESVVVIGNQFNKIVEGFNTCTLGLECLVPDEYYPHAENCIYYCQEKSVDAEIPKENHEKDKYFGLLRYKLNVFRGNEEIYPLVEETSNKKETKHVCTHPPEIIIIPPNEKQSLAKPNLMSYVVPNKPKSQLQEKRKKKIEKSKY